MKFRGKMTEVMCMKQFASVIATVARLAKQCVVRITKQLLNFIIVDENAAAGKPVVWCRLEQSHYFNEYNMAGVSEEQDEIYLEFESDAMAKSLVTLKSNIGAKSVKVKLTNKKSPCLTFEIMLSEFSHSRLCVHDIPVTVIPRRDWKLFQEPKVPNFDVSIQLPSLKLLRTVAERMKTLSPYVTVLANQEGVLVLKVETPDATVSTHFKDLIVQSQHKMGVPLARSWLTEASGRSSECDTSRSLLQTPPPTSPPNCKLYKSDEYYSARVDVRKFVQFLSSEQVNPNKVVCNIVDDQMVVLFLLHEDITLHYYLPVVSV
ncbi:hypothetical protein L9F63_008591 [Diploptera punctata]|uniref:Checkpoint protein n=1 Tax=Diploptera punctata TaxID=6984 RepID=A0AAD7Z5G6_DIPPU|nr:hypothetical protein L9F63_008591 [Diploptera punctata]